MEEHEQLARNKTFSIALVLQIKQCPVIPNIPLLSRFGPIAWMGTEYDPFTINLHFVLCEAFYYPLRGSNGQVGHNMVKGSVDYILDVSLSTWILTRKRNES